MRWSILGKHAYAVLITLDRMHWLTECSTGLDLYTDHAIKISLNMAPSTQRGNVAPMTSFNGSDPSPPLATFIRPGTAEVATLS